MQHDAVEERLSVLLLDGRVGRVGADRLRAGRGQAGVGRDALGDAVRVALAAVAAGVVGVRRVLGAGAPLRIAVLLDAGAQPASVDRVTGSEHASVEASDASLPASAADESVTLESDVEASWGPASWTPASPASPVASLTPALLELHAASSARAPQARYLDCRIEAQGWKTP